MSGKLNISLVFFEDASNLTSAVNFSHRETIAQVSESAIALNQLLQLSVVMHGQNIPVVRSLILIVPVFPSDVREEFNEQDSVSWEHHGAR